MDQLADPLFGEEVGREATPNLVLDGFEGPLDFLLRMARARQVNLAVLPILQIVEQLTVALAAAPAHLPLGQKADWVVMAAWIVQLRSNLLLPADSPTQRQAEIEAGDLRHRLLALQDVKALAAWLDRRPILGRDVFARGQPEWSGEFGVVHQQPVDVIAFLWAAMELFDDRPGRTDPGLVYCPPGSDPYSIPEAQARIVRLLADATESLTLDQLLPDDAKAKVTSAQRRRSAWSSTFVASLELVKQGDVVLAQHAFLAPIHAKRMVQIEGKAEPESLAITR
jgi:segregation and condensation protein A